MWSQKPAKRASPPLPAETKAKKMKRTEKTKPNLSYLKGCADAPNIFFNVRNEQKDVLTYPSHKQMLESLAEGSVLRVMVETLAENATSIDLPNVTPAGFQAVMRSIYGKAVHVNEGNVLDIVAASQYCMTGDLDEVLEFLGDNESDDVALKGLAYCHNSGAYGTEFEKKCWERFDKRAEDGFKSLEFLKVDVMLLRRS